MDSKAFFIFRRKKDCIYLNIFFYALEYALKEDLIKTKNHKNSSCINVTMNSDMLIPCLFPNYLSYSIIPSKKFSSSVQGTAVL